VNAWLAELRRDWKHLLRKHWEKLYWFIPVAFLSYLVIKRLPSILSGNLTNMDIIIFIIWVALIVAPLFREVNIFGVGLKNEIDSLRNDFRGEMLNLRSEIQNTINLSQQIIVGQPPSDAELQYIEERVKPALKQTLEKMDIKERVLVTKETKVPTDTQFLFAVRYAMENELRRIWNSVETEIHLLTKSDLTALGRFPRTVTEGVSGLAELEVISPQFLKLIRDINAICTSAIHGGDVTDVKVKFVREVAPSVIAYLKSIRSSNHSTK